MPHAEPHPTDDTNRYGIFIHSLLCANITLHGGSSLSDVNKLLPYFYHGKGQKSKEIIKLWVAGYVIQNGFQSNIR
jgi:hypothetical protein